MNELERLERLFGEDGVAGLHRYGYFPWTAPLTLKEREQMKKDLAYGLFEGARTGNWSLLADLEESWHVTAEVASDPDLSAALLAPYDPDREIVLQRP